MGDYKIKDIYDGGYSALEPVYGNLFKGYGVSAESIGMSTDARTANVLKEISESISSGEKTVELTQVSPEVFEAIPGGKEFNQLKELNRLSKLTGVDITIHAPVVEPSGMSREGWSEPNREAVERQMNLAVERSHEVSPEGNVPVTFHSSAILPAPEITKTKKGEEITGMLVINSDSGSINKISLKERHFAGEEKPNIQKEIEKINEESWRNSLTHLAYNTERANEIISHEGFINALAEAEKKAGKNLKPEEQQAMRAMNLGSAFLNDSYRELKGLFDVAYNNVSEQDKRNLEELNRQIKEKVEKINEEPDSRKSLILKREIVEQGFETLNKLQIPEIYKPLDDFSQDKSTTTFANVAWNSYKKFKDKAPIISIENPPAGGAFARGEDLKNIVEKSRKKFVEKAVKEGISKSRAEAAAEKLIGVTWDVGHINMLRKFGFEEKDILKETEKVAPLVKHVHLSDNFGFEHTELPMGMGNVPTKEIMERLSKKGFKGKKIAEAMSWWQHFSPGGKQNPPFKPTLQAMGSPVYAMEMAPLWNQAPSSQGYFTGMGTMLPDISYQTFGAGFAQLPTELGGQQAGAQGSRMSGRQME